MRLATAALAVTLVLAVPSVASAGVAETRSRIDPFFGVAITQVTYVAAAGERNVVRVDAVDVGVWEIRDDGATITAADGCVTASAHVARCSASGTVDHFAVVVSTADGADTVAVAPPTRAMVDGGAGDDVLRGVGSLSGAAGDDAIFAAAIAVPGRNELRGGPGRDTVRGGGGEDRIDGGTGDDRLDGGAGARDSAAYLARRGAVTVDLAARRGGVRGERDVLNGIEAAVGGDGDDVLRGNGGANALDGGGGRDHLLGRGGADALDGGGGADMLDGGDGNDRLRAGTPGDRARGGAGNDALDGTLCCNPGAGVRLDGGPGNDVLRLSAEPPLALSCGAGSDLVRTAASVAPLLARARLDGCERVQLGALTVAVVPRRAGGALVLPAICGSSCRGVLTLRAGNGRGLGALPFDLAAGRHALRVALDAADRQVLARAAGAPLEVDVQWRGTLPAAAPSWRERWRVTARSG